MAAPSPSPIRPGIHGYAAWVACAGLRDDDSWKTRAVTRFHGGVTKHIEILIRYVCTKNDTECKYCKNDAFPLPAAHSHTQEEMVPLKRGGRKKTMKPKTARVVHYLSYGVTASRDQQVFCVVGKKYEASGNPYQFIPLSTLSPDDIQSMHAFLEAQIGKPFNFIGYNLNFLCCCVQCGSTCREDAASNTSWFCSELCASALQQTGKECFGELVPCTTSPSHLVSFLTQVLHLPVIPRIVKARALTVVVKK